MRVWLIILVVLIVVALAAFLRVQAGGQSGQASRAAGSTPAGTAPVGSMPSSEAQEGFTIYFLDVGQGDTTLVVDRSWASLLVDAGRSQRRIRDRLNRLGSKT